MQNKQDQVSEYKRPESVLVVIFTLHSAENINHLDRISVDASPDFSVLMLQRNDDSNFWQSVTGSLEENELPVDAAKREVLEETGIDIDKQGLQLQDCNYSVSFEIFEQYRWRYAPGVTHNLEHWFLLELPEETVVNLTEHKAFCWKSVTEAAEMTPSWNNREAILRYLNNQYKSLFS